MIEDTALPAELEMLMDVIRRRRSIHQDQLSPEPIPMEYIQWMLEAANYAPTHGLTEPWRFTVFSGEARRALGEAFAQSYRLAFTGEAFQESAWIAQKERVWKAPVWISIGVRIGTHPKIPEWEEIAAVAALYRMPIWLRPAWVWGPSGPLGCQCGTKTPPALWAWSRPTNCWVSYMLADRQFHGQKPAASRGKRRWSGGSRGVGGAKPSPATS